MNSPVALDSDLDLAQSLESFASDQIRRWFNLCDQFLDWERARMLLQEPSPKLLEQHKNALKFLLRTTRFIQDPDYPDRSLAEEINWRLQKLEDSWLMFHHPMESEEAESILKKCFPE